MVLWNGIPYKHVLLPSDDTWAASLTIIAADIYLIGCTYVKPTISYNTALLLLKENYTTQLTH